MSTIVTRSGKGSPLTNAEMDANLTNLNTDKLEAAALSPYLTSATAASTYTTKINPTTSSTLTHSGNIVLSGTGQRITGDFSNATIANRALFQTSAVGGNTTLSVIPNGTGTASGIGLYSKSDVTNSEFLTAYIATGSAAVINTDKTGTGTYLPMTFYTGGSERMRIDTSGNVGIGIVPQTTGLGLNATSASTTQLSGYAATTYIYGVGRNANNGVEIDSYGDITFRTNSITGARTGSERLRIGSSGQLGIGGATYGTSGQVLTSGGPSAAPTWSTISTGVTSVGGNTGAVTDAQVAASATAGYGYTPLSKDMGNANIGSIVFGMDNSGTGVAAGGTCATVSSVAPTIGSTWSAPSQTSLSGTWRALQAVAAGRCGLFQRIA